MSRCVTILSVTTTVITTMSSKHAQVRMVSLISSTLSYDNELIKEVTNISGGTDMLFRNRTTGESFIVSVTKAHSVSVTTRRYDLGDG